VLSAEDRSDALAAIARMDSPAELHAVMLEYDWDDGFGVPSAVLEHPRCERGTASLIYYDAQGPWSELDGVSEEHGALLQRAKDRLLSGELSEQTIAYDPGLGRVELYKLRKAGVVEELLRPSGPK
jgi:hypothetical protein